MAVRALACLAVVLAIGGAFVLQASLREELEPEEPVWSRPLSGPWDGSPDAPTLREGCLRLLRKAREGETDALGRLDRRLHALSRDREGDHPLAHVAAWREMLREVWGGDGIPGPGIHSIDWQSPFQPGKVRFAILVGDRLPDEPFALVLSIPPPDEGPAGHLYRHWRGVGSGYVVLAPERTDQDESHPGRLLLPLRNVRERWSVDDDRIFVAGLGNQAMVAARLAAIFADRFAGLVLDGPTVPEVPLRGNLEPLPVLTVNGDERLASRVSDWLARGASGLPIRRDLFPRRIDWRIGPDGAASRAWWLLVARRRSGTEASRIKAEIRADNRIEIETEGLRGFRVLLNDRLVDLDRPVILRVNGARFLTRRSWECASVNGKYLRNPLPRHTRYISGYLNRRHFKPPIFFRYGENIM